MKKVKTIDEVPSIAAYLRRINAEPRSLRTAVVKEQPAKGTIIGANAFILPALAGGQAVPVLD